MMWRYTVNGIPIESDWHLCSKNETALQFIIIILNVFTRGNQTKFSIVTGNLNRIKSEKRLQKYHFMVEMAIDL